MSCQYSKQQIPTLLEKLKGTETLGKRTFFSDLAHQVCYSIDSQQGLKKFLLSEIAALPG